MRIIYNIIYLIFLASFWKIIGFEFAIIMALAILLGDSSFLIDNKMEELDRLGKNKLKEIDLSKIEVNNVKKYEAR